jgi:hypothetical protein
MAPSAIDVQKNHYRGMAPPALEKAHYCCASEQATAGPAAQGVTAGPVAKAGRRAPAVSPSRPQLRDRAELPASQGNLVNPAESKGPSSGISPKALRTKHIHRGNHRPGPALENPIVSYGISATLLLPDLSMGLSTTPFGASMVLRRHVRRLFA